MSSSPPAVVADRYRLVAPLGQGGMGRVWRATDVVLHRDVAIKELVPPPGLTPGERQEMRERSLREARAIARLNNINVVRVFDVLRTDADPWIVMEYVPSRSLQDTLAADGPFSPVRAAEIGLGVLGALRAAHRAGVVHRDVKPGNVLLGADGRVVLTDFGLATVPGDPNVTRTGLVLGSPAYIAPERARDGTAGPAADLWSLGATLYAAVEGTSPFARPSAIATLAALATENPPPARNAGPLKPVLNGLLRKDPTHRINAEEAERLLNRAAGRRSKLAFPMSPTMRRPGAGRDRPSGLMAPTGSTPVVPGPRPPVVPARPVDPPGRPPVSGGRPAAGGGRPPVYIPGKAQVGPAETPTRVDGPKVDAPRLDATRVDTPPVRDDRTAKLFGTSRGEAGGLTAADVAANRRREAAPEHEQSLADATALVGRIDTAPADATTVVGGPPAEATRVVSGPAADATRVVSGPATDAAGVVGSPADATTVVDAPKKGAQKSRKAPTKANPANAKPTKAGPAQAKATTEAATATSAPVEVEATPVETKATTTEKTSAEAETAEAKSAEVKAAEAKPAETDPTDAEPTDAEPPESLTGAQAVETEVAEPVSEEADAPATDKDAETGEAKAIADTPDAGTLGKSTTAAEPEADQQSKSQDGTKPQDETKGEDETKAEPEAEAATPIGPATAPAPEGPDTPGDPNPVSPAIGRSTRPAWRPMEIAPARRGGVTVFGTRLTYPQAALGAGVLLLVLVLIGVLTAQAFGDDQPGAAPTVAPTTQQQAGASQPGGNASAGAQPGAGTGTNNGTGTGNPATTAPTTPSSAPPTSSAAFTLPAGWRMYTAGATGRGPGFTIPLPNGAKPAGGGGTEVRFRWNNRLLIVDRSNSPQADAYQDWKNQESARRGGYRNYSLIKIERVKYRDYDSVADWEFLYTTDGGNAQHAVKRNIRVDSSAAYSISWYTTPADWAASQSDLQLLYQGFQPK